MIAIIFQSLIRVTGSSYCASCALVREAVPSQYYSCSLFCFYVLLVAVIMSVYICSGLYIGDPTSECMLIGYKRSCSSAHVIVIDVPTLILLITYIHNYVGTESCFLTVSRLMQMLPLLQTVQVSLILESPVHGPGL